MNKYIPYVILAVALALSGCGWLFNQEPACPNGYDESVQGCRGMPPLPGDPPGMKGSGADAGRMDSQGDAP